MEWGFSGLLLGLVIGAVLSGPIRLKTARWLWQRGPAQEPASDISHLRLDELYEAKADLADLIRRPHAVPVADVPFEVTEKDAQRIRNAPSPSAAKKAASKLTRNEAVAEVLAALILWSPSRRAKREADYESSLLRELRTGELREKIEPEPDVTWTSDDGKGAARRARPDLALGQVLVELKADLVTSTAVDRAMGQMLRYLLAWKGRGPAILVVCGTVKHELRFLVRYYVESWRKAHGHPVTVYFKQGALKDQDPESLSMMAEAGPEDSPDSRSQDEDTP